MKAKAFSLGSIAILVGGAFLFSGANSTTQAQDLINVPFIDNVKPYLEFRPRYENVHVKGSSKKDASALTIRTKVGVKIGSIFGINNLSAQIEAIDVSAAVDNYAPQSSKYETVADPHNDRITQAFLSYKLGGISFIVGRKYVAIDDHRFIGTVGWRQMPQSFGVIAVAGKPIQGLDFLIAGIYERKGILDKFNVDWKMDKMPIIIDVGYTVMPALRIKAFSYLITDCSNTYGIKLSGKVDLGGIKFSYLGEYAKQTDPYENDNLPQKPDIDTDYYRLKVGASAFGFFGNVMYTVFGDSDGKDRGFAVPLATNHKFDGWADVMLYGAGNGFDYGMKEIAVSAGYKHPVIGKFMISYLTFDADKSQTELGGSKDIGSEIDVLYVKKFTKRFSVLAKAAFYDADKGYVSKGAIKGTSDVRKYWLQLDYKY